MKASELIKELTEMLKKYGDLEVYTYFDGHCNNGIERVDFIAFEIDPSENYFLI